MGSLSRRLQVPFPIYCNPLRYFSPPALVQGLAAEFFEAAYERVKKGERGEFLLISGCE